jgi:hypothetical protein
MSLSRNHVTIHSKHHNNSSVNQLISTYCQLTWLIFRPNIKRQFLSPRFFPSLQQPPSAVAQEVTPTTTTL